MCHVSLHGHVIWLKVSAFFLNGKGASILLGGLQQFAMLSDIRE